LSSFPLLRPPLSLSSPPLSSLTQDFVNSEVHSASTAVHRVTETDHLSPLKDILSLLSLLYSYAQKEGETGLDVSMEEFHSKKLRNKLVQQIHEPVVLASGALPDWCHTLTTYCSLLFPFEVREVFFASTALGMSRSIIWMQKRREEVMERLRGTAQRREDQHEIQIGRLKQDRVKILRDGDVRTSGYILCVLLHSAVLQCTVEALPKDTPEMRTPLYYK
jgi:hypothetical protein